VRRRIQPLGALPKPFASVDLDCFLLLKKTQFLSAAPETLYDSKI